ncbi:hypothetical protein ACRQQR_16325, partial [Acinetobacter junii]|uniref:hypothetical protein n=1 Tax=Acinetobacter junii TaxID=40215 RepID=UPI003FA31C02
ELSNLCRGADIYQTEYPFQLSVLSRNKGKVVSGEDITFAKMNERCPCLNICFSRIECLEIK